MIKFRIVVAPDSFKGSLTSVQVAETLSHGIKQSFPEADMVTLPLSDGGEGLISVLVPVMGGTMVSRLVKGPLGDPVMAPFGWVPATKTAVIEMAAASGLALIPSHRRNPWLTTTYGTGQLIQAALDLGARRIIIGLGGSATTDGGAGMAQALGLKLLDANGVSIGPGAAGLLKLHTIDDNDLDRRLATVEILAVCDVDNPLLGPRGAAFVFGPQKGAALQEVPLLDGALQRFAEHVEKHWQRSGVRDLPGAGAAGGLGFGLAAIGNAQLVPGADFVLAQVDARQHFTAAQWVVTGEGRVDHTTFHGKLPMAVIRLCQQVNTPVVIVCGQLAIPRDQLKDYGVKAAFSLVDMLQLPQENASKATAVAMANARRLLLKTGVQLGSYFRQQLEITIK